MRPPRDANNDGCRIVLKQKQKKDRSIFDFLLLM